MSRTRRSVMVAAGLAAGLLIPGTAHAATGTKLTTAQTTAEMSAVNKATTAAAAGGWKVVAVTTEGKQAAETFTAIGDPSKGLVDINGVADGKPVRLVITPKGTYENTRTDVRKALNILGYPNAAYCRADYEVTGADLLSDITTSSFADEPATKTEDGSRVTYTASGPFLGEAMLTVVDGVAQSSSQKGSDYTAAYTFTYGAQPAIVVPAASTVVAAKACRIAEFRVDPRQEMTAVARNGAAMNSFEAKRTVSTLRKNVRIAVKDTNTELGAKVITVKDITNGAQLRVTSLPSKKVVTVNVTWNAGKKTTVIR
jgi:hypothetical protein